jgi:hypothetical protein
LKTISVVLLFVFAVVPLYARTHPTQTPSTVDQDYIAALAAANRFLHAWQSLDQETGLLMLSDKLRQQTSEDRLEAFFTPASSAQEAYEISRGKKLNHGRYSFPVALFATPEGNRRWLRPRFSEIIVTRIGKSDWIIDKLP